jgi:hypothetical protein
MSDSEFESATEYTSLMDAHVAPVRTDIAADKSNRRRKLRNPQEARSDTSEDDVSIAETEVTKPLHKTL